VLDLDFEGVAGAVAEAGCEDELFVLVVLVSRENILARRGGTGYEFLFSISYTPVDIE
jgi:hypothetical protein